MSSMVTTTATTTTSSQLSPSSYPLFNSLSFFDPLNHPTITDQVTLCRQIAKQLVCDESNAKSKGRQMFERRVQKSSKWVTQSSDSDPKVVENCDEFHERTISEGPPNLRLVLDPRHVQDINSLMDSNSAQILKQSETQTRNTCKHIVEDLKSPEVHPNKGNQLFAKRAQKSNEWIVADVVVEAARDKLARDLNLNASELQPFVEPAAVGRGCGQSLLASQGQHALYPNYKDFNARAKPFVKYY